MHIQVTQNKFNSTIPEFQKVNIYTEHTEVDRLMKNKCAHNVFHNRL